MMLKKEGGRRERDREIPYTIPYLPGRLTIEKETQHLVYVVIALFSSVRFKHLCHIVSGWHSP